jgi:hypothetical protein
MLPGGSNGPAKRRRLVLGRLRGQPDVLHPPCRYPRPGRACSGCRCKVSRRKLPSEVVMPSLHPVVGSMPKVAMSTARRAGEADQPSVGGDIGDEPALDERDSLDDLREDEMRVARVPPGTGKLEAGESLAESPNTSAWSRTYESAISRGDRESGAVRYPSSFAAIRTVPVRASRSTTPSRPSEDSSCSAAYCRRARSSRAIRGRSSRRPGRLPAARRSRGAARRRQSHRGLAATPHAALDPHDVSPAIEDS